MQPSRRFFVLTLLCEALGNVSNTRPPLRRLFIGFSGRNGSGQPVPTPAPSEDLETTSRPSQAACSIFSTVQTCPSHCLWKGTSRWGSCKEACPSECKICRAGGAFGGEQLVDGVCTHHCSMSKFCGSTTAYKNTDCSACSLAPSEAASSPDPVPSVSSAACSDVYGFTDKDGRTCGDWYGYDCHNHYGWSKEEEDDLVAACQHSCGACVPLSPRLATPQPTTQLPQELGSADPIARQTLACPERCQTCKGGERMMGVELVDGVCTHHCSMAGYCGTSMAFRKTDCKSCSQPQAGAWHSDPADSVEHEDPTPEPIVHDCPDRCQSCKAGKRFGGMDLVDGICTHQCSVTGHCGSGLLYKRTNCEPCADFVNGFEYDHDALSGSMSSIGYSICLLGALTAAHLM